jgi:hypothetical protein
MMACPVGRMTISVGAIREELELQQHSLYLELYRKKVDGKHK